ncbi:hypothetical protein SLEP1_g50371 [Rubroshorea leprosula]|uniref:Uncharacterized protein n=1 Tax=Rubroshorea leprosula TaxID=152421 RepID=A0AAV5LZW7_9ROSI|nr:hypothetical protein SLEP1_g50371 [Rubroshorea leprosula]
MNKGVVELKKNVNLLVHNGLEEHIGNFLDFSTFENIINLYRLLTAILAFTDYRKKVKAQYPEVDVTTVTFEGCTIFPPAFDAEFVAVEEEEEVQDAEVEDQADPAEVQPPIVHLVSSDEVHPAPPEVEVLPLPVGD